MKNLIPLVAFVLAASSFAQDRIYRCGNEYTNTVPDAKTRGCKLVEGGNVTVVQGTRPAVSAPKNAASAVPAVISSGARVGANEQQSRDSDARQILDSELKKTLARQAELLHEYNQGAPTIRGEEAGNQAKYLERVAELKASLARIDSDIAGIRRELGRHGTTAAAK